MGKLKMHSTNNAEDNILRIRELFPNCVTEAQGEDDQLKLVVDFDQLRQELSESIVEGPQERYHLNWPGKRQALLTANVPIAKTLRPCREESVDFDTTKNLFIEGDNLDALKLLQETYLGKVKMIYIDPPYNTGHDFLYKDDFSEKTDAYLERSSQKDEIGNRLAINTESNGRFHSDWLSMMYPRLKLARNLLRDDGVIFISIDDNEQANLKRMCDEVFGEENFVAEFIWKSKSGGANDSKLIAVDHEYVLCCGKNIDRLSFNIDKNATVTTSYNKEDSLGVYSLDRLDKQSIRYSKSLDYEITDLEGRKYSPAHKDLLKPNASWRWSKNTVKEKFDELVFKDGFVYTKNYKKDGAIVRSLLIEERFGRTRTGKTDLAGLIENSSFNNPKPTKLIEFLSQIATVGDSIVLDFFAGSATTAHAVMALNAEDGGNRKFIMVQIPEVTDEKSEAHKAGYGTIAEISKERIRRAGQKIKADHATLDGINQLDIGFRVLKIDSSNMADVYYTPDALDKDNLDLFVDNIKVDRTSEDLLFQIMLDWGVDLSLSIVKQAIQGKDVFFVDGNALAACFDNTGKIDETFVKELAKHQPLRVVFRDAGFMDSTVKINVEQIFKLLSPTTEVKTI